MAFLNLIEIMKNILVKLKNKQNNCKKHFFYFWHLNWDMDQTKKTPPLFFSSVYIIIYVFTHVP